MSQKGIPPEILKQKCRLLVACLYYREMKYSPLSNDLIVCRKVKTNSFIDRHQTLSKPLNYYSLRCSLELLHTEIYELNALEMVIRNEEI